MSKVPYYVDDFAFPLAALRQAVATVFIECAFKYKLVSAEDKETKSVYVFELSHRQRCRLIELKLERVWLNEVMITLNAADEGVKESDEEYLEMCDKIKSFVGTVTYFLEAGAPYPEEVENKPEGQVEGGGCLKTVLVILIILTIMVLVHGIWTSNT